MKSINFFYTSKWTAWESGSTSPYEISDILLAKLEEIREANWPEEITRNISFDIYWSNDEYSGIHNYRVRDTHLQNRYSGYLEIPQYIKAHVFQSLEEGLAAMETLNTYWGLPVPDGISQFGEHSLETHPVEGFRWIYASEWTTILGDPVTIQWPQYDI